MTIPQNLEGVPIPDCDLRSKPNRGGPHWYRNVNGKYEMVVVSVDLKWVSKFTGMTLSIGECRGRFYGPLQPTKYGV